MSGNLQLPEWFLNHNITLKANLDEIHPKIKVVCSTEAKPAKSLDNQGNGSDGAQPQGPTKFQISSENFSMFRDIMASAFWRNPEGQLDRGQSFVILRPENTAAPIDFLDELVKALAKEIGTSVISFDLEDLEDLGVEFNLQTPADSSENKSDKSKNKTKNWSASLAKHWFSSSSETETAPKKEAWERTQKSFSTILDAISNNQLGQNPEHGDSPENT